MKKADLTILQLSDLHILEKSQDTMLGINTEHYFHKVLKHAMQQHLKYDFVLLSGDLAQTPCLATYQRILAALEEYNLAGSCLNGNHDDYALMQSVFNANIHCQRQTCFEKWQIIMLNSQIIGSDKGRLAESELRFLKTCLEEKPDLFTLIATHHHCLPTGCEWLDTMQIENSTDFLKIVSAHSNARIITTGHIHQEMDEQVGSTRIFGTPSTCFQFRVNSTQFAMDRTPPGYRILTLYHDGKVDSKVHRLPAPLYELELSKSNY